MGASKNTSCSSKLRFVDLSENHLVGDLPSCIRHNSSVRIVLYAGNCLSTGDLKYQHPDSFCHEKAFAVKPPTEISKKHSNSKLGLVLGIIGAMLGGVILLGLIVLVVGKWVTEKKTRKDPVANKSFNGLSPKLVTNARHESTAMMFGALGLPQYHVFSLEEIEEATNNFDASNLIGEGSQGQLYKGWLRDGSAAVVRCLKLKQKQSSSSLGRHIEVLSKLRHEHLVSVLGHNTTKKVKKVDMEYSRWLGKVSDVKSLIPVVSKPSLSLGNLRRKDGGTVFVAGATGQAGIRIAQALLRQGFTVRAGVPDLGAAQDLARLASKYKIISPEQSKRLYAVESTYQEVESIAKAIGNASKTVVTIGPAENGPSTVVTTTDAFQVIEASKLAGVSHVAIIYDSKSNSSPSSNSVLDGISSFFGNLFSRQTQQLTITEFIQKLVETDVSYTLIKTNLTEDFSEESSYNVVVSAEGTYGANDLKVSKSQIASLVAGVFSNTAVAENKVVEVSTDPSAPSKPVDQLFSAIPEDGRRRAYAEEIARAKAEEEAIIASEKAREAAEMAKKLEEEVKKLSELEAKASSLAQDAKTKAEAAGASVENLLNKAKNMSSEFSWKDFSSQISASIQKPIPVPKVQIATIRGETKARKLPAQKAVVKQATTKPTPKPKSEPEKEVRKVFGGLFKQETIYMDD